MTFPCFHVPTSCESMVQNVEFQNLVFENHGKKVELAVPKVTDKVMEAIMATLKEQQTTYLQTLRTNDVVDIFHKAIEKWLDPEYELRKKAEEFLPIITGYDHEMVRLFLGRYLRQFRKEKLQRMIDEDFANPLILDEFRPRKSGGLYRAYGPTITTHIFSGNVPALPLWSLAAGLLLKSATLGKVSSSEPLFPVLFAKTISEIEPRLGDSLAILWWKGGDDSIEKVSFSLSNAVIAYGGKDTIESVRKKIPTHVSFHPHGHKVSFGVLTKECLQATKGWQAAKLAATDASWFDQQGCLSPHVFFVERGGTFSPKDFAQMLANEMENFQQTHARADLSDEEQHAIVKLRTAIEFESFDDATVQLLRSEQGTNWTVIYREFDPMKPKKEFPFSPLNRFVTVVPIDQLEDVKPYVEQVEGFVQTVGVGCSPQSFSKIIQMLGKWGVNRICAVGSMSHPEAGWHHDGRFHLADLVRFCDVESTLEEQMNLFDEYRE
ncbi:acyl-CoA reductase [Alkalihalobacillus sp. MEB130]|uniref:acyl-CoA reductase n=1 Tax=Alkalihalobacillus sp. MEB130 TaxID=2976704 RepID=UPI0028E0641A|nr:acyl-CoA reductase [Alkalihalobacillus sp. MEB130]MDT8862903.1 acyl-CoA reductase [Alkalihalobacillus sp. MEB130]